MKEPEMAKVGALIGRALAGTDKPAELEAVRREVVELCAGFPLYARRLEAYDRLLAATPA
jgi:glycine/serine hydroxymethyltransferase